MIKKYIFAIIFIFLLTADFLTTYGEVIYSANHGFSVKHEILINGRKDEVFNYFEKIGQWWEDDHTYSGNSENMFLELKAGGGFYENLSKGSVLHMSVVFVDSGKTVRMTGGLGPLQSLGVNGSMTWSFEEAGEVTKLVLLYNVSGYTSDGLEMWAEPVDGVLKSQLESLKIYAER